MNFNTTIFSKNNDYILELGNIYHAKQQIDTALTNIIPNVKNYQSLAQYIELLLDSLDDLKMASKRCVEEMEEQRKSMYNTAKKMIMLKEAIKEQMSKMKQQHKED